MKPRVSFGIIVLNGEPFVSYTLRALYPFAHQIIVVEGATPTARNIAKPDGHSLDSTLETLRAFKETEDPEDKVTIVTAEMEGHMDGFWPGEKDEQSRAYAKRATGSHLWQVDIDEFYRSRDMEKVLWILERNPTITAVSFHQITFWGGFDYLTDSWYLRQGAATYHRLFKWGPGYSYHTHRPPTVLDPSGRNLRDLVWLKPDDLARQGIMLYHYSLLFPKQVYEKARYYALGPWGEYSAGIIQWAEDNYFSTVVRPFRMHNVHTHPGWVTRFSGEHPEQVAMMKKDLGQGTLAEPCRRTDDIEKLLGLREYRIMCAVMEFLSPFTSHRLFPRKWIQGLLFRIAYDFEKNRLYLER
ncbi:MAG TPA: glycosyltransferase family A protein [Deltaproteobacteria bacterium]|jgi:hypothetical protein|nr:glycosyltransferase family A protein [Deltaproteobacteria bacterium]HOI05884.1 glycosyltransferase family A protein [Deltaproteobacteria bacterium]